MIDLWPEDAKGPFSGVDLNGPLLNQKKTAELIGIKPSTLKGLASKHKHYKPDVSVIPGTEGKLIRGKRTGSRSVRYHPHHVDLLCAHKCGALPAADVVKMLRSVMAMSEMYCRRECGQEYESRWGHRATVSQKILAKRLGIAESTLSDIRSVHPCYECDSTGGGAGRGVWYYEYRVALIRGVLLGIFTCDQAVDLVEAYRKAVRKR
jgi:hypothetical protein